MADLPPSGGRPVFVDRASYRQRRLRDGLRLLPVLGALLWFVPLLWPRGEATTTSTALTYVFGAWVTLIVLAFLLARALRPEDPEPRPDDAPGGGESG